MKKKKIDKKQAIKDAFSSLRALSPTEFSKKLQEHKSSPVANTFIEAGMFDGNYLEAKSLPQFNFERSGTYTVSSFSENTPFLDLGYSPVSSYVEPNLVYTVTDEGFFHGSSFEQSAMYSTGEEMIVACKKAA